MLMLEKYWINYQKQKRINYNALIYEENVIEKAILKQVKRSMIGKRGMENDNTFRSN